MSIRILICVLVFGAAACDSRSQSEQRPQSAEISAAQTQRENTERAPAADSSKLVRVLFFGTSLTAGYGLDPSLAFPNLIEKQSRETSTPITAINAGLSGETSAGAVRRIDWALKNPVDIVVLETGGNDALRALDPDSLEANLSGAVVRIRAIQPQAKILLVVMEAPPNLGPRYTARFRKAYSNVAAREKLTLVPFLLNGVAGKAELNQSDGVHPNEKGEPIVADNVWKVLQPMVREVYRARQSG
jgi:acyl-CoA thioesterase-1